MTFLEADATAASMQDKGKDKGMVTALVIFAVMLIHQRFS